MAIRRAILAVWVGCMVAGVAAWASSPPELPREGTELAEDGTRSYGTDKAIQVTATVYASPPQIVLNWPEQSGTTGIDVYRKGKDDTSWGTVLDSLVSTATTYVDTTVTSGTGYEYRLRQGTSSSSPQGYVCAGILVPWTDYRGKIVLLVDGTHAATLSDELETLKRDLVGDGWQVVRHDIGASATVPEVKALIVADYTADPDNVKAVYIFGHVPVPYSGNQNPDGHSNHRGAWPADAFYGDMDGVWTDTTVDNSTASKTRNHNTPGDGKYDQTYLSGDCELELAVGRVDLHDMPAYSETETELLRRYLNKSHNFKSTSNTATVRALVCDNFGGYSEGFSQSGWRLASLVGKGKVSSGAWSKLIDDDYLWAYGCGGGTWNRANRISTTTVYAVTTYKAMFNMIFGSYFGDFDCSDNFLRAPLGNPTYGLINVWAGRPHWFFHHMGLGETTGFAFKASTLSSTVYAYGLGQRGVHTALMGDPSLRLFYASPPTGVVVMEIDGGASMYVVWNRSNDPYVFGYNVYRASDIDGAFTRLNEWPVSGTSFVDSSPLTGDSVYMVRAVKVQLTPSGSYYNQSIGAFSDGAFSGGALHGMQLTEVTSDGHFYVGAFDYSDNAWKGTLDNQGDGEIAWPIVEGHWVGLYLYDYDAARWNEAMYVFRQSLADSPPMEFLANPDFEGAVGSDGLPEKWLEYGVPDGVMREITVVDGRQGKGVQLRDEATDGSLGLIQDVQACPGKTYRFSCWKKGDALSLYLQAYDGQGQRVLNKSVSKTNTDPDVFEEFFAEATIPEEAIVVRAMIYSSLAHTGTAIVDDVSLEMLD